MANVSKFTKISLALAAALAFTPALSVPDVRAQSGEGAFLANFEGEFSGRGTVQRGGEGGRNISCNVTGTQQNPTTLSIEGSCGALIFRSGVSATIRYDEASGSYTGLWRDRNSTSDLSGSRSGDTLTLNIQRRGGAAESGAAGQMVVRAAGPNQYQLTVETVGKAKKPRRVNVTLQKS